MRELLISDIEVPILHQHGLFPLVDTVDSEKDGTEIAVT